MDRQECILYSVQYLSITDDSTIYTPHQWIHQTLYTNNYLLYFCIINIYTYTYHTVYLSTTI